MSKRHLSSELIAHHKQLIAREAILLVGVMLVALLLQLGGHQIPTMVLDVALICVGPVGMLMATFLGRKADRWWFIALASIAMVAGMAQLFWSSGAAVGLLSLIVILPIGDALGNILILGRQIWLDSQGRE